MLMHPDMKLAISEMDDLFPGQPFGSSSCCKAEETLHSHLIMGFEEALSLGLPPMEALGHVLCWVASEMGRIGSGQDPQGGEAAPAPRAG